MSGSPDSKVTATGGIAPAPPSFDQSPIRSMLPDGTILQFPPGTSPEVVDRVFKQKLGEFQAANPPAPAAPAPPQVGAARAAGIGATQGLTANFGDEIASGIAATVGYPPGRPGYPAGDTWGQRYDSALGEARGVQHAAKDQHPYAYGAGQVGGAILPAVVAPEMYGGNFVAAAPTAASAALRGGLTGAGYGALTGFGEGEGGPVNRAVSATEGAAVGGATGAVTAPIVRAVGNAISPVPNVPASQTARVVGDAAYHVADQTPVNLEPTAIQNLAQTVQADLRNMGRPELRARLQPRASAVLDELTAFAGNPNPTIQDIEMLRRIAGGVFDPNNRGEGEMAGRIIDHIDDFMENLQPHDVVNGNSQQAVQALQAARMNWSAFRKSQLIETAIQQAQDRANSTGTGGNAVNAIRQNLRRILDNPRLSRGFTDNERTAIRQVVQGGPMANASRLLAMFAPSRGGFSSLLGGAAALVPGGAAIPFIGEGAHIAAQDATLSAARDLPRQIVQGVGLPVAPNYSQMVARALSANTPGAVSTANAFARALLPQTGPQQ